MDKEDSSVATPVSPVQELVDEHRHHQEELSLKQTNRELHEAIALMKEQSKHINVSLKSIAESVRVWRWRW